MTPGYYKVGGTALGSLKANPMLARGSRGPSPRKNRCEMMHSEANSDYKLGLIIVAI